MASLYPLVIPLNRISYRETINIKSDLVPWIHITGREDLCAVFEKETVTSRHGFTEQQTLLKVKAGVQALDAVVLEDLVCQFAVQERRLSAFADTPIEFAIYTSCPNMALRYLLPNGHYRKVQLLFRDTSGFTAACKVLETFKLPLVQKSASSSRIPRTATDNMSLSSRPSIGPQTIFSHASQSTKMVTTPQIRDESDPFQSNPYLREENIELRILGSQLGLEHETSGTIVHPGPSLIESIVEPNHHAKRNPWQFSEPRQPRQHFINGSVTRDYDLIRTSNEPHFDEGLSMNSFLQTQEYSPSHRPASRRHYQNSAILHSEIILPTQRIDLQGEPMVSSQLPKAMTIDRSTSPVVTYGITKISQRQPERILELGAIEESEPTSLKRRSKSAVSRQGDTEHTASVKATPKRKRPRKTFKSSATQTEVLLISKSTQTEDCPAYKSVAVQVELVTPTKTFCDQATQVSSCELPDPFTMAPNPNKPPKIGELTLGNATLTYALRSRKPGINKFGRGRKHVVELDPELHEVPLLEGEIINEIPAGMPSLENSIQRINKFNRRTNRTR